MCLKTRYNQCKRVLCPHCQGEKNVLDTKFIGHSTGHVRSTTPCAVCDGEGIVNVKITYTTICDEK